MAFSIDGIQQFSLYYQILVNKLFFVVTQEDRYLKGIIDEGLVPLFEEKYRKKFEVLAARETDLCDGKEHFSDWESAKEAIRGAVK